MTKEFDPTLTAPGVFRVALPIVNAYIISDGPRWILVDAGLPGSATRIKTVAAMHDLNPVPEFIVLTHAHFDHVGSLKALLKTWNVPVYAHRLEQPYLTGQQSYPLPNAHAGGLMSALSPLFPRRPLNIGDSSVTLQGEDAGILPGFPEWRWWHTPGHSVGHVSLWREADRTLVAGDAITTTHQASALEALLKPVFVSGPPPYFTPDWFHAKRSVTRIAALEPALIATGHGIPMRGHRLKTGLQKLLNEFETRAVPENRRGESLIPAPESHSATAAKV